MARLTGENIERYRNYSGDGQPKKKRNYLTLKDHGATANGRILCNDASEIECYVVHRVKVGDYEREVNCLIDDEKGVKECPFCSAQIKKAARLFIPFYDYKDDSIKIFERPNSYYGKVSGYCARYAPIVNYPVEIVRNGKPGDTKTDYDIFPDIKNADDTTVQDILDDLGEDSLPSILGSYVLDKSFEDMEYYVQHDEFPSNYSSDSAPVRRRTEEAVEDEPAPRRRNANRGRGDRF